MEANVLMTKLIAEFPNNLSEALEIAKKSSISKGGKEIKNILICGMGGSGIGGRIVSQWLADDLKVPVGFCQDYILPSYVDENTLVIGSSYSGNTEETLMSLDIAISRGARIIGITSGGKLAELCKQNNFDVVIVPGGNPPRAAMAYSIVQLVSVFQKLDMCPVERIDQLKKAEELIVSEQEGIQIQARELAEALNNKIPVFYATSRYEGLTVRARQQFNENSKKLCLAHVLPEMNHNELLGWGGGDSRFGVVFLDTQDLNERNAKRMAITRERVSKQTDTVFTVLAKGDSIIEKTLYLNNIIDWTTLFVAEINGTDSIEIDMIDYLKDALSKV